MSNLGTVYEISLENGYKNVYPVVYKNKTRLFCKIYGCDELQELYTEDYPYSRKKVVSLEQYKKLSLSNDKWYGWVYVPPHVNYWFPELKESIFDRKINANKNKITNLKRRIKVCEEDIKTRRQDILDCYDMIQKIEKDIIKYEELRLEYRKEHERSLITNDNQK